MDTFFVSSRDVGAIQAVKIRSDGKGLGAAWLLDRVDVSCEASGQAASFVANRWFDAKHGLEAMLTAGGGDGAAGAAAPNLVSYQVAVFTSNISGAGTDGDVFLTLVGQSGSVGEEKLVPPKGAKGNLFEAGKVDEFVVSGTPIGPIKEVVVRLVERGFGAAWHLDRVMVRDPAAPNRVYVFPCREWLKGGHLTVTLPEASGAAVADLAAAGGGAPGAAPLPLPGEPYRLEVVTSKKRGAGTDATIGLQFRDVGGQTWQPRFTQTRAMFESGKTDSFDVTSDVRMGDMSSVRVWQDGSGMMADWHLDHVLLTHLPSGRSWLFECKAWVNRGSAPAAGNELAALVLVDAPLAPVAVAAAPAAAASVPLAPSAQSAPTPQQAPATPPPGGIQPSPLQQQPAGGLPPGSPAPAAPAAAPTPAAAPQSPPPPPPPPPGPSPQPQAQVAPVPPQAPQVGGGMQRVQYELVVHTGDKMGAGTDALVHMEMTGSAGSCVVNLPQVSNGGRMRKSARHRHIYTHTCTHARAL